MIEGKLGKEGQPRAALGPGLGSMPEKRKDTLHLSQGLKRSTRQKWRKERKVGNQENGGNFGRAETKKEKCIRE